MQKKIQITSKISNNGFVINHNGNDLLNEYQTPIWDNFPKEHKQPLVDSLAFATTVHLGMVAREYEGFSFDTNRPQLEPYFIQNFLYDIPSCADIDKRSIQDEIKRFLHLITQIQYQSQNVNPIQSIPNSGHKALIAMSFGKDSLLSYALADELQLDPEMIYVIEGSFQNEQRHKVDLATKFKEEFGKNLNIFMHETGRLRDYIYLGLEPSEYGWGLQNTEYTLEFLPYAYGLEGKYIIFGNEQSCSYSYINDQNWQVHPCYDQSHEWTVHLNQITELFSNGTIKTTSLIEPLMDIFIQRMLINRYPHYAKYQMSCFAENEAGSLYKWCQDCKICAKMYLLSVASGMDPKKIGFTTNMLDKQFKSHYTIFGSTSSFSYLNTEQSISEQLFCFYNAYKNESSGTLLDDFRSGPLYKEAKDRLEEFFKLFYSIYDAISIPSELKDDLLSIFREEVNLVEYA